MFFWYSRINVLLIFNFYKHFHKKPELKTLAFTLGSKMVAQVLVDFAASWLKMTPKLRFFPLAPLYNCSDKILPSLYKSGQLNNAVPDSLSPPLIQMKTKLVS